MLPGPTASRPVAALAKHAPPTPAPAAEAAAVPEPPPLPATPAVTPSQSTSVGGPNAGGLIGGIPLPLRGPGYRFDPRRPEQARYGNVELVQSLVRAAARVQTEVPGGELTVGDLSLPEGGPIAGHGSHQGGRDVDVLFFYTDPDGAPTASVETFVDPRGRAMDFGDPEVHGDDRPLRFDAVRSWRFIAAMLDDPATRVQRIFLAEHVRSLLLREARRARADRAVVARFSDVTCEPSHPHDDHFHIRLFCSTEDLAAGCRDGRPMYPWRRRELRSEGQRPRFAGPERMRAPLTTLADSTEATLERDDLEPTLRRWLVRRETWRERPHPGRRWCR